MKIKSVEIIDEECEVYDIEVEHDHSYIVEGVVVHNCPNCYAAEMNGPYKLGTQPHVPQHPACRCVVIPRILKERNVRASTEGPTRDTIEQFFNRMTDAERTEYMGPSRAALWKAGKIDDIRDLVNSRTLKPLNLDQLPKL